MKGPLTNGVEIERQLLSVLITEGSLLDIGAGIRPFDLVKFSPHVCIEPYEEYANVLREKGYEVIQRTALNVLRNIKPFDVVMLLDVLEHMYKREAIEVLKLAQIVAKKQIIVFTPLGFISQGGKLDELDAWGYKGNYWQMHRSGWLPEEFPEWEIFIDEEYEKEHGAFIAVYTK